jgi:hypothetical protein
MSVVDSADWRPLAVIAALCVVLGLVVTRMPLVALGLSVPCAVFAVGLAIPATLRRLFLRLLGLLLIGYAFAGRTFAYLGVPPVFMGDVVLGLGLFALVVDPHRWSAPFQTPLTWILAGFAFVGAARTVPYLSIYRTDALRDGVIWAYGLFALLAVAFIARSRLLFDIPRRYATYLPWFLLWAPIGLMLTRAVGGIMPSLPGSGVPLLTLKPGDIGVHLAGAAAFMLVWPRYGSSTGSARIWRQTWFAWTAWTLAVLVVASLSRSGFLSVLAGISVVVLLRPVEGSRMIARITASAGAVVLMLVIFDVSIDIGDARKISPSQIAENAVSISNDHSSGTLEGSRTWRLMWWNRILGYTVHGDYFWTGKGFGINLADADGFQVYSDHALRSPHNGHLTILARSGVPGFALWALLQLGFAAALVRATLRAYRRKQDWWARLNVWILAYWLACVVNGGFDVFLEGPQGGIWFWSIMGFGMAALITQRTTVVDVSTAQRGRPAAARPMAFVASAHG